MLRRWMPKSIPSPRRTAAKAPVRILTWPKISCKIPKVQIRAMAKGRSMRKRIRNRMMGVRMKRTRMRMRLRLRLRTGIVLLLLLLFLVRRL